MASGSVGSSSSAGVWLAVVPAAVRVVLLTDMVQLAIVVAVAPMTEAN